MKQNNQIPQFKNKQIAYLPKSIILPKISKYISKSNLQSNQNQSKNIKDYSSYKNNKISKGHKLNYDYSSEIFQRNNSLQKNKVENSLVNKLKLKNSPEMKNYQEKSFDKQLQQQTQQHINQITQPSNPTKNTISSFQQQIQKNKLLIKKYKRLSLLKITSSPHQCNEENLQKKAIKRLKTLSQLNDFSQKSGIQQSEKKQSNKFYTEVDTPINEINLNHKTQKLIKLSECKKKTKNTIILNKKKIDDNLNQIFQKENEQNKINNEEIENWDKIQIAKDNKLEIIKSNFLKQMNKINLYEERNQKYLVQYIKNLENLWQIKFNQQLNHN